MHITPGQHLVYLIISLNPVFANEVKHSQRRLLLLIDIIGQSCISWFDRCCPAQGASFATY
jgi:hypothetical protein